MQQGLSFALGLPLAPAMSGSLESRRGARISPLGCRRRQECMGASDCRKQKCRAVRMRQAWRRPRAWRARNAPDFLRNRSRTLRKPRDFERREGEREGAGLAPPRIARACLYVCFTCGAGRMLGARRSVRISGGIAPERLERPRRAAFCMLIRFAGPTNAECRIFVCFAGPGRGAGRMRGARRNYGFPLKSFQNAWKALGAPHAVFPQVFKAPGAPNAVFS